MANYFPYVAAEVAFGLDPGLAEIAYVSEVLKDLPVAYLRLNDASGGAVDLAPAQQGGLGYGTTGRAQSQTPLTADPTAKSARFTGVSGDTVSGFYSYNFTTGVTFEIWAYITAGPGNHGFIESAVGGAVNTQAQLFEVSGTFYFGVNIAGTIHQFGYTPAGGTALNTWYHVVGTYDGATVRVYVNGVQIGSGAQTGSITVSASTTLIGALGTGVAYYMQGNLEEAAIYQRALSADRIAAHYAARTNANPRFDLPSIPFTNITRYVRGLQTSQGRQTELDRFEPGSASVVLNNDDRRFEPEYAGDPGNLFPNPRPVIDTSGWVGVGTGSLFSTLGGGRQAFRISTGATIGGGAKNTPPIAVAAGTTYTASWEEIGDVGGEQVRTIVRELDGGGATLRDTTFDQTMVTFWDDVRRSISFTALAATATVELLFTGRTASSSFFVTKVRLAPGLQTDYIDGDSDGANWVGTRFNSASVLGAPYYPNVIPQRKLRIRAAWPPQLVPDGHFERAAAAPVGVYQTTFDGFTGWKQAAAFWTNVAGTLGPAGTRMMQSVTPASTLNGWLQSPPIPVDVRVPYTLAMIAQRLDSNGGGTNSYVRVQCYDDAGFYLGSVYLNQAVPGVQLATPPKTITTTPMWLGGALVGQDGVADDSVGGFLRGTKYVCIELHGSQSGNVAVTINFDAVSFTPGIGAYTDGSTIQPGWYAGGTGDAGDNDAWVEVWNGFVEDWGTNWPSARHGIVNMTAVDALEWMAQENIAVPMPQHVSGTRVAYTLDAAGWPRSERTLQSGQEQIQAGDFANNLTQPPNHLADVAATDGGVFFIARDGKATFQDRNDRIAAGAHSVQLATFGDGGPPAGELPYVTIQPSFDLNRVYNRIRVTPNGLSTSQVDDQTSQRQYHIRELSISTLHTTTGNAAAVAGILLGRYKQPIKRFDAITVEPTRNPDLWTQVLHRAISDRVTVVRRPPGSVERQQTADVKQVHIERVEHQITLVDVRSWQTKWQLTPADTQAYWILGTTALDTARLAQ